MQHNGFTGMEIKPGTFLLITSWMLLPLSHWTHSRGAEASLLITGQARGLICLSLSLTVEYTTQSFVI